MRLFTVDTDDHIPRLPFTSFPRHKRNPEKENLTHAEAKNSKMAINSSHNSYFLFNSTGSGA